jgi:phosphomethylpyrimidine synthase
MKISQDVRDYAAGMSDNEKADLEKQAAEAKAGMDEMSDAFKKSGGEIYVEEG